MVRRTIRLAAAALLALPLAAVAQDAEDEPQMLQITAWQCPMGGGLYDKVDAWWNEKNLPISQQMVDEGKIQSAGIFYHAWADEWNVQTYVIAKDIPTILAAVEEMNERGTAMYPDDEGLSQWCTTHRDGFYQFGKSTEDKDEG